MIEVAAGPAVVFGLARDVTTWESLLPHYARSRLVRRDPDGRAVVAFVARRPLPGLLGIFGVGLPVVWRSRVWSDDDGLRLRFVHLGGATRGMDVTWMIEPAPSGCSVTIQHDFRPRLAIWATLVDRWFTRPIAGRTLATFKALAEAVESGSPSPTNRSV